MSSSSISDGGWFRLPNELIDGGHFAWMGQSIGMVFVCLARHRDNETGKSYPQLDTIMRETGIWRKTVMHGIATLVKHGYIERQRDGRRNIYTILPNDIPSLPSEPPNQVEGSPLSAATPEPVRSSNQFPEETNQGAQPVSSGNQFSQETSFLRKLQMVSSGNFRKGDETPLEAPTGGGRGPSESGPKKTNEKDSVHVPPLIPQGGVSAKASTSVEEQSVIDGIPAPRSKPTRKVEVSDEEVRGWWLKYYHDQVQSATGEDRTFRLTPPLVKLYRTRRADHAKSDLARVAFVAARDDWLMGSRDGSFKGAPSFILKHRTFYRLLERYDDVKAHSEG